MRRLAAAALLVAVALLCGGADCNGNGITPPPRTFRVELHAHHPAPQAARSHPIRDPVTWDGVAPTMYFDLTPPIDVAAEVKDPLTEEAVVGACAFLDTSGQLGDVSATTDSNGLLSLGVVPSTYDVLVAPDCLLGESVGRLLEDVILSEGSASGVNLDWSIPPGEVFRGRVDYTTGDPVAGAIVSFFDGDRPEYPLGVTAVTDELGEFEVDLPGGDNATYDIVVSAPADGSVPIPPIHLEDERVPLLGTTLVIRYPVLPLTELRGQVFIPDGSEPHPRGRILIEGFVPPAPTIDNDFSGGWFRAELPSQADGRFALRVPFGSYRVGVVPDYADTLPGGMGMATEVVEPFEPGTPIVDGIEVLMDALRLAKVILHDDDGEPVPDVELRFHQLTPPFYGYVGRTDEAGEFTDLLPKGLYDVEAIPPEQLVDPTDPDGGTVKRWARARGTYEHAESQNVLELFLRRSDEFGGLVQGPSGGVANVRVLIFDPDTGALWDEAVTNRVVTPGFFRGTLPR